VRSFEEARARLQAQGCDQQTVWASLERLNLGRLRVAAKGLRRETPGSSKWTKKNSAAKACS